MLFSGPLNPLISGGGGIFPPYLGYLLPLAITKHTTFPKFSPEIIPRIRPKTTPFPEKWEHACPPLCIQVGGGGGGGQGREREGVVVFNIYPHQMTNSHWDRCH